MIGQLRAEKALENASEALLAEMGGEGGWRGELSSSALATAVAVCALEKAGRMGLATRGRDWIRSTRNVDGGWGDSPESPSNFTATLLCRCVLEEVSESPAELRRRILDSYGADRTFSVPILTMCRLSGVLNEWTSIPQLPFEWAALPHRFYRWLRLPVVSYALPALIAIGLVRHRAKPSRFVLLRRLRDGITPIVLRKLERMQPASGGFLEAVPLTGFVAMSLLEAGEDQHPVTRGCLRFLEETARQDAKIKGLTPGLVCWPIDVDLSLWVTSLAIRALGERLPEEFGAPLRAHLLEHQWKEVHPFTQSAPGGWAWTDRRGGVPDADDTAAALLALAALGKENVPREAVVAGVKWLLDLQNRDGGMPTFCRGWGQLPFDRSCPDLTAHALQAWAVWKEDVEPRLKGRVARAERRAWAFLKRQQRGDGAWLPLWFGRQGAERNENPIYGTACVLKGFNDPRGVAFLAEAEPEGVEEWALRLAVTGEGLEELLALTEDGRVFPAAPIGLYFASLWYAEKIYPLIFTVDALRRYIARLEVLDEGNH